MFLELATTRRSIRKYLAQPVEPEKVDLLLEAALRAPSSRGLNPWHFVVVSDRDLLTDLAESKAHGTSFLRNAPLAIVVCADPEKSDVWVEDASIATTFIHLAAASLGLGSCWIQVRARSHSAHKTSTAFIAEKLALPPSMEVEAIVAVGYPAEHPIPHPRETLLFERISYNRFGARREEG
jgi:nitroreductase